MSPNEDCFSPKSGEGVDARSPRRRTNTTPSFQVPTLQHQPSTQSQSQQGASIETQLSNSVNRLRSRRSNQGSQHGRTSGPECTVQQSDAESACQNARNPERQQTEKKTDEKFYVDNDYYSLNPWYEHQPPKPLFGLGRPFPRTVRPGMFWGRKKPKRNEDGDVTAEDEERFAASIQIVDEHGEDPGAPPDEFITNINGYPVEVRRIGAKKADQEEERGVERLDHYDSEGNQDQGANTTSGAGHRYQPGLSPLQETDTISAQTTQAQKEKKEIETREQEELQAFYNNYRNPWARLRAKYPEFPAELLATTIYIFFGITGNLYAITYPAEKGDYSTQAWAWGIAVTAGIYVAGGISGAHMSPWVSICFSVYRGFPWRMCFVYAAAQMLAGFIAGALAWGVYRDAIFHTDPQLTPDITGKAFFAIPQSYVSTATAFFNNFVSSALYVCIAFAIGDDSNTPPGSGLSALIYGLMTYMLTITMGYNGLSISPSRDLGPRCVAWWVGYGRDTFATGWWAYGPIAAGLSGSLFGALLYDVFVFVGGESPVNYSWPGPGDIKWRLRERKKRAKRKVYGQKLPV